MGEIPQFRLEIVFEKEAINDNVGLPPNLRLPFTSASGVPFDYRRDSGRGAGNQAL